MISTGYLMHEGVVGMRWGVRNGPPYPIDRTQNKTEPQLTKRQLRKQKDIIKKIKTNTAARTILEIAQIGYDIVTFDVFGVMMDTIDLVNATYDWHQRKKLEKICDDIGENVSAKGIKIKK